MEPEKDISATLEFPIMEFIPCVTKSNQQKNMMMVVTCIDINLILSGFAIPDIVLKLISSSQVRLNLYDTYTIFRLPSSLKTTSKNLAKNIALFCLKSYAKQEFAIDSEHYEYISCV